MSPFSLPKTAANATAKPSQNEKKEKGEQMVYERLSTLSICCTLLWQVLAAVAVAGAAAKLPNQLAIKAVIFSGNHFFSEQNVQELLFVWCCTFLSSSRAKWGKLIYYLSIFYYNNFIPLMCLSRPQSLSPCVKWADKIWKRAEFLSN